MSGPESDSSSRTPLVPRDRLDDEGGGSNKTGCEIVVQRVVKEKGGTVVYPMLTRSNYGDWSLLMRVNLQAQGLWSVIEPGGNDIDYRDDRLALSTILRAVPSEMLATIAMKDTAKDAWETVKTMRMGAERVRQAKAQSLRSDFESLRFKDGETVDEFAMRLTGLVNNLAIFGDKIDDEKVVRKFLRVVPRPYSQVAISIETLVDLSTLTIEELTGRLKAVEERYEKEGEASYSGGRLLLKEEEWLARLKKKAPGESSFNGDNNGGGSNVYRHRGKQRGRERGSRSHDSKETILPVGERDMSKIKCYNCNYYGHFSKECRRPRRERKESVNLAVQDDAPALLMAEHCEIV